MAASGHSMPVSKLKLVCWASIMATPRLQHEPTHFRASAHLRYRFRTRPSSVCLGGVATTNLTDLIRHQLSCICPNGEGSGELVINTQAPVRPGNCLLGR